ncbi:hypothetical protein [Paenibacillus silvae]|uniref:Uncharacterized protein n=1 Tax=Paenibacillus silvae TaxID=1325358 RepID=A0A2W6P178_9BACL|nr:hypothetical protein [Paenibacillus silvae]PZT53480.1 hypothetical protein DN757_22565 [Paenibacillus silvae]
MRKKIIFGIIGVVLLVLVSVWIYRYAAPSLTEQEVTMTGTIRQLDSETVEVELAVTRTKEDHEPHFIFPLVPGWGGISFTEEQEQGLFRPSSVGTSYHDQVILEQMVKMQDHNDNQITKQVFSQDLTGFSVPDEAGTYKMRFTLKSLDETVQPLHNPMVYYVHNERWLGKNLSWAAGQKLDIVKEEAE